MERKFATSFKKVSKYGASPGENDNLNHFEDKLDNIQQTINLEEQLFNNWDSLQKNKQEKIRNQAATMRLEIQKSERIKLFEKCKH